MPEWGAMRLFFLTMLALSMLGGSAMASGAEVYEKHCASCHHRERWGLSGPPLLPEYFGQKKEAEIMAAISEGMPATNMPAFKGKLLPDELRDVAAFIRTKASVPLWSASEMLSTRKMAEAAGLSKEGRYDMEDFFMVVEGGTGKVHFMDGRSFTILDSVKAGAIHGGPKFDNKLKNAYMVSRDGWVVKYDLAGLREAGRIRAGVSARNIAISADGRHIAVASLLPEAIVMFDSETLKPVKSLSMGALSAVYSLKGRASFLVAFKDRPELALISQDGFKAATIEIDQPLTDFFIEPSERYVIGTSREGGRITVVDLEEGRVVKSLESKVRMPHLASAALWSANGSVYAAFPHIGEAAVSVMELYSWEIKKTVRTKGPGFFARAHEYAPHIWVDTNTDTIQLIDKKSFEVVGEITPEPGKKAMHIEFTKEGSFALVSIWEDDGAVVVYDSRSLKPIKSLPFKKPVGKYNAFNKKS
jgi:cytochrome c553